MGGGSTSLYPKKNKMKRITREIKYVMDTSRLSGSDRYLLGLDAKSDLEGDGYKNVTPLKADVTKEGIVITCSCDGVSILV